MSLAEAAEIFACWERNPPAHLLLQTIAHMLGWAPPSPAAGPSPIEAIGAAPPPGLAVARGGDLGMPFPLDLDTLRTRNWARAVEMARRA